VSESPGLLGFVRLKMKRGSDNHQDALPNSGRSRRHRRDQSKAAGTRREAGSGIVAKARSPKRRAPKRQGFRALEEQPIDDTVSKAFLNLPFHEDYENVCLALICGLVCYGITPTIVTESTGSRWRLEKLAELISRCEFSFHDLSYLKLDGPQRVPRFNIPFELGLAIGLHGNLHEQPRYHVFESKRHRLQQSLSDLNGIDPLIYNRTAVGILRALANRLRQDPQPSFKLLRSVFRRTSRLVSPPSQRHVRLDLRTGLLSRGGVWRATVLAGRFRGREAHIGPLGAVPGSDGTPVSGNRTSGAAQGALPTCSQEAGGSSCSAEQPSRDT